MTAPRTYVIDNLSEREIAMLFELVARRRRELANEQSWDVAMTVADGPIDKYKALQNKISEAMR